jgi:bifunctional non-homologous end joining protein LigD
MRQTSGLVAPPAHISPMLATVGTMPARPEEWVFEYKWDGVRALGYWNNGEWRLQSRSLRDITAQYPELTPTTGSLPRGRFVVDGEIVAADDEGRPSFARLQRRMHALPLNAVRLAESVPAYYFVFDLLWLDGKSLSGTPYRLRRAALERLPLAQASWRVPAAHPGEGPAMLRVARKWGLEGIVAKRPESLYRAGLRSPDWLKIKIVQRQEFVVGGWEPRREDPRLVGSLLVGYYSPRGSDLIFAGRVGTGFSAETHRYLLSILVPLRQEWSPFGGAPGRPETFHVAPKLVVEVEYRRWPDGGDLQQASYLGLRDDVPPPQVIIDR